MYLYTHNLQYECQVNQTRRFQKLDHWQSWDDLVRLEVRSGEGRKDDREPLHCPMQGATTCFRFPTVGFRLYRDPGVDQGRGWPDVISVGSPRVTENSTDSCLLLGVLRAERRLKKNPCYLQVASHWQELNSGYFIYSFNGPIVWLQDFLSG